MTFWIVFIVISFFYLESTTRIIKKIGVKLLKDHKISKSLNDCYDFTDYVEENSLSLQAGARDLDLRCPKALWKMCKNQL